MARSRSQGERLHPTNSLTLLLAIKHKQKQTKQEFGQGHLLCSNVL